MRASRGRKRYRKANGGCNSCPGPARALRDGRTCPKRRTRALQGCPNRMDIFADRLDSLSYLIRTPRESGHGLLQPVLCFLHGDDAGAPVPIRTALLGRGPLAPGASERAAEFLVIAPQLPHGGDTWNRYSATVREIILDVR